MPRYYRRRYTKVVRPKKKWASNIKDVNDNFDNGQLPSRALRSLLVVNSGANVTPTPVVLKTGNFKVQMDVSYIVNQPSPVEIKAFVMYVPEGTDINDYGAIDALIVRHPEWVIAWKYASIDYVTGNVQAGTETLHFSSRLKRNLNSGDAVWLFTMYKATAAGSVVTGGHVGGMVQFWTCAN